jgi:hypothetical protein
MSVVIYADGEQDACENFFADVCPHVGEEVTCFGSSSSTPQRHYRVARVRYGVHDHVSRITTIELWCVRLL